MDRLHLIRTHSQKYARRVLSILSNDSSGGLYILTNGDVLGICVEENLLSDLALFHWLGGKVAWTNNNFSVFVLASYKLVSNRDDRQRG